MACLVIGALLEGGCGSSGPAVPPIQPASRVSPAAGNGVSSQGSLVPDSSTVVGNPVVTTTMNSNGGLMQGPPMGGLMATNQHPVLNPDGSVAPMVPVGASP